MENLPKYLPPIKDAGIEGSAAEGSPGERIKMRVEIPDRGEFKSEGYFDGHCGQRGRPGRRPRRTPGR